MMEDKKTKALQKVKEEIEKINKKENNVFFFVLDTKGNPSGSLEYIYNLALITKNNGYKVSMLYQEEKKEDFVGVGEWLGEEYANIPHYNIASDDVEITPSDILFIPEIFANVMNQTKKLPCKRIALFQNYDFLVEQMPFAAQWGDFGILEAITNTEHNAKLIKDIYPYVKTTVIQPFIKKYFGNTNESKKMVVNIVAENQSDINKIIKPFYWKYPSYKWVSFRDLRGFPKTRFAELLREGAITVWVDDKATFGYGAIEAMKSGSVVIAKVPETPLPWMESNDENQKGVLKNCCLWFDDFHEVQRAIANVVRAWITDKVPDEIQKEAEKVSKMYNEETTTKQFLEYLTEVNEKRKAEMEELYNNVTKDAEAKNNKKKAKKNE